MKLQLVENVLNEANPFAALADKVKNSKLGKAIGGKIEGNNEINDTVEQLQQALPYHDIKKVRDGIEIYPKTGYMVKINVGETKDKQFVVINVEDEKQNSTKVNTIKDCLTMLQSNNFDVDPNDANRINTRDDLVKYLTDQLPTYKVGTGQNNSITLTPQKGYIAKVLVKSTFGESLNLKEGIEITGIEGPDGVITSVTSLADVVKALGGDEGMVNSQSVQNNFSFDQNTDIAKANVSQEIQQLIAAGNKWQDALNKANANEKPVVIDAFIGKWCEANNIDSNRITPTIHEFLSKWIMELGFRQNLNPFLDYLEITLKSGYEFTEDTLICLNNLYANKKVSSSDLRAKGKEKQNHIVFNRDWVEDSHSNTVDDQQFIAEAYVWLSNDNNVESLKKEYETEQYNGNKVLTSHIDEVANSAKSKANPYSFPKQYQTLSRSMKNKDIRNIIIFKDMTEGGTPNWNSILLQAYTIQQALHFDGPNKPEEQKKPGQEVEKEESNVDKLKSAFSKLSDEEKAEFLNALKNEGE